MNHPESPISQLVRAPEKKIKSLRRLLIFRTDGISVTEHDVETFKLRVFLATGISVDGDVEGAVAVIRERLARIQKNGGTLEEDDLLEGCLLEEEIL